MKYEMNPIGKMDNLELFRVGTMLGLVPNVVWLSYGLGLDWARGYVIGCSEAKLGVRPSLMGGGRWTYGID